jgi:DNA-binding GntR family transcriptional regulator
MDPKQHAEPDAASDAVLDPGPYTEVATPLGNGVSEPAPLRRDEVYAQLRRRVMLGEFGVHTRLVEERLAGALGVSRTPVREALVRLLADGLVARHEGGYYVAIPDLSQLQDLYELRITLELRGLTRSLESETFRHDPALLEPLRDLWVGMADEPPDPDPQFVLLDEDFHVTLLRSAGNLVLTETLESVNARIRAVRMYDFLTADRIERTVAEHTRVLESVLRGDIDKALAELRSHVGLSMDVVEQRAASAISRMALSRRGR